MLTSIHPITIPAVPGPQAERKTCIRCGRILADVWCGWVFMCHRRRKIVAQAPVMVICECGVSNTVEA